jgi:hypothetical protein
MSAVHEDSLNVSMDVTRYYVLKKPSLLTVSLLPAAQMASSHLRRLITNRREG